MDIESTAAVELGQFVLHRFIASINWIMKDSSKQLLFNTEGHCPLLFQQSYRIRCYSIIVGKHMNNLSFLPPISWWKLRRKCKILATIFTSGICISATTMEEELVSNAAVQHNANTDDGIMLVHRGCCLVIVGGWVIWLLYYAHILREQYETLIKEKEQLLKLCSQLETDR